jgi:hypothetical protein
MYITYCTPTCPYKPSNMYIDNKILKKPSPISINLGYSIVIKNGVIFKKLILKSAHNGELYELQEGTLNIINKQTHSS